MLPEKGLKVLFIRFLVVFHIVFGAFRPFLVMLQVALAGYIRMFQIIFNDGKENLKLFRWTCGKCRHFFRQILVGNDRLPMSKGTEDRFIPILFDRCLQILDKKAQQQQAGGDGVISFLQKSIQDMIDDAELITLDAGANDLLKQIKVSDTGVSLDPAKVPVVLEQVKKNTSAILREIKKQNSRAKVYVMGYYNSFPYIPKEQQEQLIPILDMLNNVIADEAKRARAKFVPTADAIDEDFRTYLPNPQNIHLSEAGYQVVADEFWKEMKQEFSYRLTTDDRFIYMTKGQEQTLKLVIVYPSKKEIDVQKLAEWSSSNEDIVSVDEGVITAHKKGYAVITAKYEGQRIKISVRVN